MAKLKRYVSGYRPPSLAPYPAEVGTVTRRDNAYLHWLCEARHWYTVEDETCQECAGTRLRPRKRRVATCYLCGGSGKRASERRHDIGRARTYVERQRYQIEMAAQRAIDIARWCLIVRGAKPVAITTHYGPQYYREWVVCDRGEAIAGLPEGYWDDVPHPRSYVAEREDLLTYQGHTIYIGIRPRAGGWDRKAFPHHFDLLIRPGMAPSEPEVGRLVDALLDDINASAPRALLEAV